MANTKTSYPASLSVEYPKSLDRVSSFFRLIWSIPILIILSLLSASTDTEYINEAGQQVTSSSGGIMAGIAIATALMIAFRQKYPRWWFDFALELTRFSARVGAYLLLLTDKYPSTTDKQSVTLNATYPDAEKDLDRLLPLLKWILAIPHYIVLAFLMIGVLFATIIAWFSILFTGTYPRSLFDYVVGVGRWALRVNAYAFLLVTDEYPPFSLD